MAIDTISEKVIELANCWKQETAVYSASWQIKSHPAFREIACFGTAAIEPLLKMLRVPCIQWLMALCEITGEDPAPIEHAGDIARMAEDWMDWGRKRGYLHGHAA